VRDLCILVQLCLRTLVCLELELLEVTAYVESYVLFGSPRFFGVSVL
jgi:hypothetical protein